MKKLLIVGCVLLLCCCVSSIAGFAAIGYFESNGSCVYRGPFATVSSGACVAATNGTMNSTNSTNTTNTTNSTNQDSTTGSTDKVYVGAEYSLTYPQGFIVDDSDNSILFVYAANELDNLNISKRNYAITATQNNCEDYAYSTLDELVDYDAILEDVSVVTIGGYKACKVDFSADYGTSSGIVYQTQYYIAAGASTYFETITINLDDSNFDALDNVARSIQFN